eukprot:g15416.t1
MYSARYRCMELRRYLESCLLLVLVLPLAFRLHALPDSAQHGISSLACQAMGVLLVGLFVAAVLLQELLLVRRSYVKVYGPLIRPGAANAGVVLGLLACPLLLSAHTVLYLDFETHLFRLLWLSLVCSFLSLASLALFGRPAPSPASTLAPSAFTFLIILLAVHGTSSLSSRFLLTFSTAYLYLFVTDCLFSGFPKCFSLAECITVSTMLTLATGNAAAMVAVQLLDWLGAAWMGRVGLGNSFVVSLVTFPSDDGTFRVCQGLFLCALLQSIFVFPFFRAAVPLSKKLEQRVNGHVADQAVCAEQSDLQPLEPWRIAIAWMAALASLAFVAWPLMFAVVGSEPLTWLYKFISTPGPIPVLPHAFSTFMPTVAQLNSRLLLFSYFFLLLIVIILLSPKDTEVKLAGETADSSGPSLSQFPAHEVDRLQYCSKDVGSARVARQDGRHRRHSQPRVEAPGRKWRHQQSPGRTNPGWLGFWSSHYPPAHATAHATSECRPLLVMRWADGAKVTPRRSKTALRKYYHLASVFMFAPVALLDPVFLSVAFSGAMLIFVWIECLRIFRLPPFGPPIQRFYSRYLDDQDRGALVLTHLYLLLGCALPVWMHCSIWQSQLLLGIAFPSLQHSQGSSSLAWLPVLAGVLSLGVGDTAASFFGYFYGTWNWPHSRKTIEGNSMTSARHSLTLTKLEPVTCHCARCCHSDTVARCCVPKSRASVRF